MTFKHKYDPIPPLFNDEAVTFVKPEDLEALADEAEKQGLVAEVYTCADTMTRRMEVDFGDRKEQFACELEEAKKPKPASKPATVSAPVSGEFIQIPKEWAPQLLASLKRQREELDTAIANLEASL